ncbi:MAG: hypothetical protein ACRCX8_05580 [Sarcina sp.]
MTAVIDAILYTFNSTSSTLLYNESITFNSNYTSEPDILFIKENSPDFCITKPGHYSIDWWVATQSGSFGSSVAFSITYTKNGVIKHRASASPLKTGIITGNAILHVEAEDLPFTFQLTNVTGYGNEDSVVVLALNTIVQAGLTVIQLDHEGIQGPKGDIGPQGPQGPIGPKGERGEKGIRGDIGPRGLTGERGPQGFTGERGIKGDIGPQGPQGIKGDVGPKGDKGDVGPKGEAGIPSFVNKLSSLSSSITNENYYSIPYQSSINFVDQTSISVLKQNAIVTPNLTSIKLLPNGDITFLEAGLYDLAWYICIEGTEQISEFSFSVIQVLNSIPLYSSPLIKCTYPTLIVGAIHSQGLITVTSAPMTIRIINSSIPSGNHNSTGKIQLDNSLDIKGKLKIIAYTISE